MTSKDMEANLHPIIELVLEGHEAYGKHRIKAVISDDGHRLIIFEDTKGSLLDQLIALGAFILPDDPAMRTLAYGAALARIEVEWDIAELTTGNGITLEIVVDDVKHLLYDGRVLKNFTYIERIWLPTPEPQPA